MDITEIDKNFANTVINEPDICWHDCKDKNLFNIYGISYDNELNSFCRLNYNYASKINSGIQELSLFTAGGRIKFTTDSDYIAIKFIIPLRTPMNNMNLSGQSGLGIYVDGIYRMVCCVNVNDFINAHKENKKIVPVEGIYKFTEKKVHNVEIYTPLYNGLKELYIGLSNNSNTTPEFYDNNNVVAFYGSSITQGGCASHPGNDYISMLSRDLNFDYINFGFSGRARGETLMAEKFALLKANIFVIDYDYNAVDAEELKKTHYKFYQIVRDKNPDAPIIFITRPNFDYDIKNNTIRRDIVFETYKRSVRDGDKRTDFIDGEKLFGKDMRDACTVDTCHPNDLGFYRMAKTIKPKLKKWIKKAKRWS